MNTVPMTSGSSPATEDCVDRGAADLTMERQRLRGQPAWGPRAAWTACVPDRGMPAWGSRHEAQARPLLP